MQFLKHDLGIRSGGEVAEVKLTKAANVRLLDSSNFQNYRSGRRHRYFGGYVNRSPVRLQIPNHGHWYVVVDLGGYAGRVGSSVRVLPGKLRPFQEQSLAFFPTLLRNENHGECDVFISHAAEDKEEVVRPLAEALQAGGLSLCYDEFDLSNGNSFRNTIDKGIAKSRFGIIVISKAFFRKGWPQYELDELVTCTTAGEQQLLPIWHNVTKDEVISHSPSLADTVARNTSTYTVEEIAKEVIELIQSRPVEA